MPVRYHDASPEPQTFALHVKDCWGGLGRIKRLAWVDFSPGGFDAEECNTKMHFDSFMQSHAYPNKLNSRSFLI